MKVEVRLFARARDLAGAERVSLELTASATVADLRQALGGAYPALAPLLGRSAIGQNQEFAQDADAVIEGAELALLPPVSGGEET
jgi:molybdopterin converting factor small subunit